MREWEQQQGWGVLDSEDLPGPVYAHQGSLRQEAVCDEKLDLPNMGLRPGTAVQFAWSSAENDPIEGCPFYADAVWPRGMTPRPRSVLFETYLWISTGSVGTDGLTTMREVPRESSPDANATKSTT